MKEKNVATLKGRNQKNDQKNDDEQKKYSFDNESITIKQTRNLLHSLKFK